jgi:pyruvyl transferase EpsO
MTTSSADSELSDLLSSALGGHLRCVLLDYPDHLNAGDHLIWLSTIQLLNRQQVSVAYCASLVNFSPERMALSAGAAAPILLQGGGNLGDLWPDSQLFREKIVSQYRDRAIVILPQSVYFSEAENAQRAAAIFNAHPNLTLFVRDQKSFDLATSLFTRCRLLLTPDMTLWPEAQFFASEHRRLPKDRQTVLFLYRQDAESNLRLLADDLDIKKVVVEDWRTYDWAYAGRGRLRDLSDWYWRIPGAVSVYRECWQRGLSRPAQLLSRLRWEFCNPFATHLRQITGWEMHYFSLTLLHDAITQIDRCRLVVTDRLHGQCLAHLLGVPSILVPNAYHKNESFFSTWMQKYPDCHFASNSEQLRTSLKMLLGTG